MGEFIQTAKPRLSLNDSAISASEVTTTNITGIYKKCVELNKENKVSEKNAFDLKIIDCMSKITQQSAGDDNFQRASTALDASTVVWSKRVDSLHIQTNDLCSRVAVGDLNKKKSISGQNQGLSDNQDYNGVDDVVVNRRPKRTKKLKLVDKNIIGTRLKNKNRILNTQTSFSQKIDMNAAKHSLSSLHQLDDQMRYKIVVKSEDSKDEMKFNETVDQEEEESNKFVIIKKLRDSEVHKCKFVELLNELKDSVLNVSISLKKFSYGNKEIDDEFNKIHTSLSQISLSQNQIDFDASLEDVADEIVSEIEHGDMNNSKAPKVHETLRELVHDLSKQDGDITTNLFAMLQNKFSKKKPKSSQPKQRATKRPSSSYEWNENTLEEKIKNSSQIRIRKTNNLYLLNSIISENNAKYNLTDLNKYDAYIEGKTSNVFCYLESNKGFLEDKLNQEKFNSISKSVYNRDNVDKCNLVSGDENAMSVQEHFLPESDHSILEKIDEESIDGQQSQPNEILGIPINNDSLNHDNFVSEDAYPSDKAGNSGIERKSIYHDNVEIDADYLNNFNYNPSMKKIKKLDVDVKNVKKTMWNYLKSVLKREGEVLNYDIASGSVGEVTKAAQKVKEIPSNKKSQEESSITLKELISVTKDKIGKADANNLCFGTSFLSILHIANEKGLTIGHKDDKSIKNGFITDIDDIYIKNP